ncbi:Os05g0345100 [Oryza sativa Japonica Group]|uniref:Os05g0345100 protein n=1 Tax=Oryza sativa subsp. japonica TaxID=39947 RepID=A0A0P0WL29_ORYSJ|nr:Os05g0345100 [Oryza sativa Japonica Group]
MSPTATPSPAPAAVAAAPKPPPSGTGAKRSLMSSLMEATALLRSSSFKEDSYVASALPASDLRALADLRALLSTHPDPISIWGVPLNPAPPQGGEGAPAPAAAADERADVVLLKFLRARDFRVRDAHAMLLRCAAWRAEFRADAVLDEDLGFKDLEGVVAYMHGWDREGHPVTDLKDMPKRELRAASNQILSLFQDNYPEMVARKVFINVPWYFSVLFSMISPFLTERTKSKFVIAREGNVAETLFKFIRPELVPVQYGGLSRAGDLENGPPKPASEFTIKGGEKVFLEIDGIEVLHFLLLIIIFPHWELRF